MHDISQIFGKSNVKLSRNKPIHLGQLILTRISSLFNGEGIKSSTFGARTTGYPHTNEWSCTLYEHQIQKLSENGSKI